MGLSSDQDGIFRRYLNEGNHWKEHLDNTKKIITDFIREKKATRISIFGSGWLLDVPINMLAKETEKVVFYDLRHPSGIVDKYGRYPNFQFIETDLTGGLIEKIYTFCKMNSTELPENFVEELTPVMMELPVQTDFFISVNILSQLNILLLDYLKKKYALPAATELNLKKLIQTYHLRMLKPEYSCLITDTEELHINENEEVIEAIPLLFAEFPGYHSSQSWIWQFDTQRTYYSEYKTYMRVMALNL